MTVLGLPSVNNMELQIDLLKKRHWLRTQVKAGNNERNLKHPKP